MFCATLPNAPSPLQMRHLCRFPHSPSSAQPTRVFVRSKNRTPSPATSLAASHWEDVVSPTRLVLARKLIMEGPWRTLFSPLKKTDA